MCGYNAKYYEQNPKASNLVLFLTYLLGLINISPLGSTSWHLLTHIFLIHLQVGHHVQCSIYYQCI
jgi:hypothetical protein